MWSGSTWRARPARWSHGALTLGRAQAVGGGPGAAARPRHTPRRSAGRDRRARGPRRGHTLIRASRALIEAGEVDDEPIAHVVADHPLVRFVHLLDGDDLHVGAD